MKVKAFIRHKWVVPVAALVLVFAIGAGAWAATGANVSGQDSDQDSSATPIGDKPALGADLGLGGVFGLGHMRGLRGKADNEQAQQLREKMQSR
ncbi:MAG: hypothetical protein ACPLRM_09540, partial [Anaerolineae bacterium]